MIKLIASDLDGTLLDDDMKLPDDFAETIGLLSERGITFAAASGRSYADLRDILGDYLDKIAVICDNGAVIVLQGDVISRSVIPESEVTEIIDVCEENGMLPLICTPDITYISEGDTDDHREAKRYFKRHAVMKNLRDYSGDLTKIAVFQGSGIEDGGLPVLRRRFGERFNVTLSGKYWSDIMNVGVNKGRGLEILAQRLGTGYESIAAFGDYLNDVEMLRSAYYSFAMKNAHPDAAGAANFHTGLNVDGAVTKEIKKLLQSGG